MKFLTMVVAMVQIRLKACRLLQDGQLRRGVAVFANSAKILSDSAELRSALETKIISKDAGLISENDLKEILPPIPITEAEIVRLHEVLVAHVPKMQKYKKMGVLGLRAEHLQAIFKGPISHL